MTRSNEAASIWQEVLEEYKFLEALLEQLQSSIDKGDLDSAKSFNSLISERLRVIQEKTKSAAQAHGELMVDKGFYPGPREVKKG